MQGAGLLARRDQAEGRLRAGRAGGEARRPLEGPRRPGDLHATRSSSRCRRTSRRRASCRRRPSAARSCSSSKAVGCATCHSGPYYTDSSLKKPFKLHDVGTGGDDPTEKMGPKYDTPTLLGVYRTAPYLHHGKAKTLRDVLTTCNKERQARQDEPSEAGRDRRPGGVPEVAALRDAAERDAEHGASTACAAEEGVRPCRARFRGWIRIWKIRPIGGKRTGC